MLNGQQKIDWKRTAKFLRHEGVRLGKSPEYTQLTQETLIELSTKCGEFSRSRRMLQKIGTRLLQDDLTIIAPACPDYSHRDERYTFESLSGGVSLLTQKHIAFLQEAIKLLPGAKIVLLMADHEADNPELCRAVGKNSDEFRALVQESVKATRQAVASLGWEASCMTELIPGLVDLEREGVSWISSQEKFRERIDTETSQRSEMYWRINPCFNWERMVARTIETAAQYVVFGRWAAENGYLLCNHTTVNLSWYLQTEAAVLHNPATVY